MIDTVSQISNDQLEGSILEFSDGANRTLHQALRDGGLLLLAAGVFFGFKVFNNEDYLGSFDFYKHVGLAAIAAFLSVYLWASGHYSRVIFDNSSGTITRQRRDGLKRSLQTRSFDDFEDVILEQALGSATPGTYMFDSFVTFKTEDKWHLQRIETPAKDSAIADLEYIRSFVKQYLKTNAPG